MCPAKDEGVRESSGDPGVVGGAARGVAGRIPGVLQGPPGLEWRDHPKTWVPHDLMVMFQSP